MKDKVDLKEQAIRALVKTRFNTVKGKVEFTKHDEDDWQAM
jgi:hypothetical protein